MDEVEGRDGFLGMGKRGGVGKCWGERGDLWLLEFARGIAMGWDFMYLDWMTWIERDWMGCDTMKRLFGENGGDGIRLDGTEMNTKMEHDGIRWNVLVFSRKR